MKFITINGIKSKYYKVDIYGNVYSVTGNSHLLMKPYLTNDGYRRIKLSKDLGQKHYRICRLVAETYLDNPQKLPIVNHKNENRADDRVDNLEWVDNSKNQKQRFSSRVGTKSKEVQQICIDTGSIIKVFVSPIYAEKETGIARQNISKVCRGLRNQAGGFKWKYTDRRAECRDYA
ncbi:hypothetical protein [Shouchella clausii]|uniref:hypothetical protein n=1 Tax=Shouchella clausii TaxID=79880 RepID=UPI00226D0FAC|nr:hypothetical protein [Shouchella clausii]MCY1105825.1 hypothetical protein [Shouchella clausii]